MTDPRRAFFDEHDHALDYGEALTVWPEPGRTCADCNTLLVCPECGSEPDIVCGLDNQGAWWRLVCACGCDLGGVGYRWRENGE